MYAVNTRRSETGIWLLQHPVLKHVALKEPRGEERKGKSGDPAQRVGVGEEALSLLSDPGKEREEGVGTKRRNEKSRFSFLFLSKQKHRYNHRH